ncbi:MAG: cytochrome c biogenesis protein CcsA [Chthoniobacterales bacterium]
MISAKRVSFFLIYLTAFAGCVFGAVTDFTSLDRMVIQNEGRKKPYLVFAQEALLSMSGKTALTIDEQKIPANEVITTMWLQPEGWNKKPLILINNLLLKKTLGLPLTEKWFPYEALSTNEAFQKLLAEATEQRKENPKDKLKGLPKEASTVALRMAQFESLTKGTLHRVVPNLDHANGPWSTIPEFTAAQKNADPALTTRAAQLDTDLSALQAALKAGNQDEFNKQATTLESSLRMVRPEFFPSDRQLNIELTYQHIHPFRWAWIFYAATAIVLALTSVKGRRAGYLVGWVLVLAGFGFQVYGFTCRILVGGRPPVTNMYESVIWVACGAIFFSLVFEAIYRSRYFLMGATPVAVIVLILADTQPLILNPAINPLTPVLRDNFWLTTHVLTITLSYAAFLLATGVGHIALGLIAFKKQPTPALYNYIYRTLQVGVLLLATGTILGGVWANYSWGRFWDWDPKETWALIALLTYLFVLHGRIAGSWSGFGLAVGSVVCFLSVVMSWYGVNFILGVGLHSYGFGNGGFSTVGTLVGLDLGFVAFSIFRHRQMKAAKKNTAVTA